MNKEELIPHLRSRGFSERVVKAFEKVRREDFVPLPVKQLAYEDTALPLLVGDATISQPFTIAFMLDLLQLEKDSTTKILEIGSGSGYVLALLYEITKGKIFGVEIIKELAEKSRQTLNNKNIKVFSKNGINGLSEHAPYDRILISAAAKDDQTVRKLTKQLKENGIIVASVQQKIIKLRKQNNQINKEDFYGFVFVPLQDS